MTNMLNKTLRAQQDIVEDTLEIIKLKQKMIGDKKERMLEYGKREAVMNEIKELEIEISMDQTIIKIMVERNNKIISELMK